MTDPVERRVAELLKKAPRLTPEQIGLAARVLAAGSSKQKARPARHR